MARSDKRRNNTLDYLLYLAVRVVAALLHCFPVDANLRSARLIGRIMYRFDRRHRERALGNLRRSFPDMPESQREIVARRCMEHLIMFGVEVLFTTSLVRLETWRRYVHLGELNRTIELMLNEHRGLIMLTGHYGNWEILGYTLAVLGFPTTSIARTQDNPYLNDFILGVREKMGQRIIDKEGASDIAMNVLTHHGALGFIADQNAGRKGIFVDFFGRKASTYKSIGLLAMQFEVPVAIGYARRIGDRFQYEVGVDEVIYPEDWRDQPDPLKYITQRYTRAIENFVRAEPSQYLWMHRRWKTRPKGEAAEKYD
jgi:KDO2-lipid IV(A) lauroyltransferase